MAMLFFFLAVVGCFYFLARWLDAEGRIDELHDELVQERCNTTIARQREETTRINAQQNAHTHASELALVQRELRDERLNHQTTQRQLAYARQHSTAGRMIA